MRQMQMDWTTMENNWLQSERSSCQSHGDKSRHRQYAIVFTSDNLPQDSGFRRLPGITSMLSELTRARTKGIYSSG